MTLFKHDKESTLDNAMHFSALGMMKTLCARHGPLIAESNATDHATVINLLIAISLIYR